MNRSVWLKHSYSYVCTGGGGAKQGLINQDKNFRFIFSKKKDDKTLDGFSYRNSIISFIF